MMCDADRVRTRREALGMTQEKLAAMSNVQVRTIQRLEAGAPVSLETLADVAAALRWTPEAMGKAPDGDPAPEDAPWSASLRRVGSARSVFEVLEPVLLAKLECRVSPTRESLVPLKRLVLQLEAQMPPEEWDTPRWDTAPVSLADRLDAMAELEEALSAIEALGLALYAGRYTELAIVPRWDMDEGCYFTKTSFRPEPVELARLVIAPSAGERLTVSRAVAWSIRTLAEEEIPF